MGALCEALHMVGLGGCAVHSAGCRWRPSYHIQVGADGSIVAWCASKCGVVWTHAGKVVSGGSRKALYCNYTDALPNFFPSLWRQWLCPDTLCGDWMLKGCRPIARLCFLSVHGYLPCGVVKHLVCDSIRGITMSQL